jgi:ataxia telangiectasia mutated family protein
MTIHREPTDDIRQDAVMQQVFSTMNVFLRNQKEQTPNDRNLRLVTYNCIPLSPAAGVLQWVDETVAIGHYLTAPKSGAHERYYPGEWSNHLCRQHMDNCPQQAKRVAFDEVCKHFSPAFRFFFLERFSHSPQLWYTARMAYTRSCAVNSFVGHILGTSAHYWDNLPSSSSFYHNSNCSLLHVLTKVSEIVIHKIY